MAYKQGEVRDNSGNIITPGSWGIKTEYKDIVNIVAENMRAMKEDGIVAAVTLGGKTLQEIYAYTDGAIATLVNSAPAALDTIYELSNALGNDPNFSTTVLNLIGTKAAKGANSDITSLSGLTTALSIGQGGTGATTAAGALANLGADAKYAPLASPVFNGSGGGNTPVVRINTTDPAATFNWASSAINPNVLNGKNIIHMIGTAESVNNCGYIGFNTTSLGSSANFLTFGIFGDDNLLNIFPDGKVGINTITPTYNLEIASGGVIGASVIGERIFANASSTATSLLAFGSTANILTGAIGAQTTSGTAGDLVFQTANNSVLVERMRINSAGNVGINHTGYANSKLTIKEDASGGWGLTMLNRDETQAWGLVVDTNAIGDKILGFFNRTNGMIPLVITPGGGIGCGGVTDPKTSVHSGGSTIVGCLPDSNIWSYLGNSQVNVSGENSNLVFRWKDTSGSQHSAVITAIS